MNNRARNSKAAAGGVAALAFGLVGTTMLVGQLAADTPDSTTVDGQQPAAARHYGGSTTADAAEHRFAQRTTYAGPTTPDAAEHWFGPDGLFVHHGPGETYIIGLNETDDRVVRDYIDRIVSGRMSMQDFETIADARLGIGEWTQDMVDRIVGAARTMTGARLYQGCQVYSAGRLGTRPGC